MQLTTCFSVMLSMEVADTKPFAVNTVDERANKRFEGDRYNLHTRFFILSCTSVSYDFLDMWNSMKHFCWEASQSMCFHITSIGLPDHFFGSGRLSSHLKDMAGNSCSWHIKQGYYPLALCGTRVITVTTLAACYTFAVGLPPIFEVFGE